MIFLKYIFSFALVISITACSYSFTGASVPSHLKTIAIPVFKDQSGSGEPEMSDLFTRKTVQKFVEDNTLRVTDRNNADAIIDCTIQSLNDAPAIVSGNETVTQRRLTITVKVIYRDMVKKVQIFDRSFSNYGDYPVGGDITIVRRKAFEDAIDKISEDILLGVVSNW
ncbi:MAG: LPS assembly lipoprotein LptE [Melioribacteraceae bacterium]|nr:LPS assembly lipoprotein LptE [Melioribacteraceae bacterium]